MQIWYIAHLNYMCTCTKSPCDPASLPVCFPYGTMMELLRSAVYATLVLANLDKEELPDGVPLSPLTSSTDGDGQLTQGPKEKRNSSNY